jgi:PP-loop superfamily ATP-utilizing enzyme
MKRLSVQSRKKVLNLFLSTSTKRIVEINKVKKTENPCYACIRAYLDII